MAREPDSVTLAIPCFNGAATLGQVLVAVGQLSTPPDELLVVDDGSQDGSAEVARRHGARVFRHDLNLGLAAARNTCLQRAAGEIVIFVDADTLPDPELVQHLVAPYADPSVAGVGGEILEGSPPRLPDRWRALFWRQTQGPGRLTDAPFVIGACCSLQRAVALEAGGFSAAFPTNGEDVELSARLRARGYRLVYDPSARVTHLRRDSLPSLLSMVYRHQRDHVRALRTHDLSPAEVVGNALRWGPIVLASSLGRHRSPALAALAPLCYGASLAGCTAGLLAEVDRSQT
jgi:GT2 family glycosyltransferase